MIIIMIIKINITYFLTNLDIYYKQYQSNQQETILPTINIEKPVIITFISIDTVS